MTGFEYQVAGHMIAERMVQEGLAVTRAIHDRYHASKRNPWNEIECGDHYSRAMAGYGVFITACGYEHHGPKGHLGFNPRLTPENFRAPFTASEGWGTFSQKITNQQLAAEIDMKSGRLQLNTLALGLPSGATGSAVRALLDGKEVALNSAVAGERLTLSFTSACVIGENQKLVVQVS